MASASTSSGRPRRWRRISWLRPSAMRALGAVNGQIFTGARIGYALGQDHPVLSRLGVWSRGFGTPAWALVVQALITLTLIAAFGSRDGFETLVKYTAAVFSFF